MGYNHGIGSSRTRNRYQGLIKRKFGMVTYDSVGIINLGFLFGPFGL